MGKIKNSDCTIRIQSYSTYNFLIDLKPNEIPFASDSVEKYQTQSDSI